MDKSFEKNWESLSGSGGVFIIAEAGKNFIQSEEEKTIEEYLDNAKQLALLAKEAGADAVKFQTHNLEDEHLNLKITSPHFELADRYNWIKRNEKATPIEFWAELKSFCDNIGILFFSTPMSRGAAQRLEKIGVPVWKVGSGDLLDFVLLDYLAETGKPIIISSGMSTLGEIDLAVEFLKKRNVRFALLHCVSKYPCPAEELSLETINFLRQRYGVLTGFSDHSIGIESAVEAINFGAKIIEKHFSLSRNLWGADHKVSMMPAEFKEMVLAVRNKKRGMSSVEPAGKFKIIDKKESAFRPIFRKTLVAARDIKKGEIILPEMVFAMRPQIYCSGLPSENYEKILGKRSGGKIKKFQPIEEKDIEWN